MIWLLFACQSDSNNRWSNNTDVESTVESASYESFEYSKGRYNGDYLMALFSCHSDICMNPNEFNHKIWIGYSDDGKQWYFPEEDIPFEGSVPDIVRRDDTLYAFGGKGTVKRYHFTDDYWEDPVEYSSNDENIRWRDKSPIIGEDGLIHLFFLASEIIGDPAECPIDNIQPCLQYFRSAIEVPGSNGTLYELNETINLTLELQPGERASDPDIFRMKDGKWGLLITLFSGTALYTSDEMHGVYEPEISLGNPPFLVEPFYSLGVSHYISEYNEYWTYVSTPEFLDNDEVMIDIKLATHDNFSTQLQPSNFSTVIESNDGSGLPESYWAASPGFTFNQP